MIFKGKDYDTDVDSKLYDNKRKIWINNPFHSDDKLALFLSFLFGFICFSLVLFVFFTRSNSKEKINHNFYQMCIDDEIVELRVDEQGSKQSMTYYKLNEKCDWGIE